MSNCDILILEDEALIAMDIEMTLEDGGHRNIVVCHTVKDAMKQIDRGFPKLALLDFNLGNKATSVPVAERLCENSIPVIFLSGYTESTVKMPETLANTQRLAKPFQSADLVAKVDSVLKGSNL